jgi:serine/threonine protein kinase
VEGGESGMGEVYRARDTKLKRDVAVKVLPDTFARDADRLARFEREAELLATLNHPNIAAICGLEESDGVKRSCSSWSRGRRLLITLSTASSPSMRRCLLHD